MAIWIKVVYDCNDEHSLLKYQVMQFGVTFPTFLNKQT